MRASPSVVGNNNRDVGQGGSRLSGAFTVNGRAINQSVIILIYGGGPKKIIWVVVADLGGGEGQRGPRATSRPGQAPKRGMVGRVDTNAVGFRRGCLFATTSSNKPYSFKLLCAIFRRRER